MADFQTSSHGNIQILSVAGRLDPQGGKDFKDAITALTDAAPTSDLIVDLEHLDYMASAGFRELFMAGRKIDRAGARLVVASLRGEVKRVFELAGFDTAYRLFDTQQEAIDFLQAPRESQA
jgi:anti-sigma B factor antagonist